ncbi:MAG: hypothetical protein ACRC0A_04990 [Chitinophagaceae bacterium]
MKYEKIIVLFLSLNFFYGGGYAMPTILDSLQPGRTPFVKGISSVGGWSKPFWADINSTISKGELVVASNFREYDWSKTGKKYKPFVVANLGIDAPLWAGNIIDDRFSLSFTVPYLVEVWVDMFERTTAPVINTMYRFGSPEINFIQRFPNKKIFKNYSIKFAALKHECTHIGDELAVERISSGIPITRVNVSYNYSEIVFTINDPDNSFKRNNSYRFGLMVLHYWKDGWYNILMKDNPLISIDSIQQGNTNLNGEIVKTSNGNYIFYPKTSPIEYYFQYQYQTSTSKRTHLQGIVSLEIRGRMQYKYPFFEKYANGTEVKWQMVGDAVERRAFTGNLFIGMRFNNPNPKIALYNRIGIGLRCYVGMNPYGQFRSIPSFQQIGLALLFE